MLHRGWPPDVDSPWYPTRRELLGDVEIWWELDQLGGGVLVGLHADGSLVFIEGNEPHPGYRREYGRATITAAALIATRRAPVSPLDEDFLAGIIRDLEAWREPGGRTDP